MMMQWKDMLMSVHNNQIALSNNDFHILSYEGFPIHFKEYSHGLTDIPLVFIGGAFQNIDRVEKVCKALAQKTWVISVDTPGNGNTGVLPSDYDFDFICAAIQQGLKTLGVNAINLLGGSYGSIVAMRYAQKYIGVNNLVLCAAMESLPDNLNYEFNKLLFQLEWDRIEEFADGFTNLMTNPDLRKINRLARIAAEKLRGALLASSRGIREQFRHNTLRILRDGHTDLRFMPDVPTTVYSGEYDNFIPASANIRVANSFPRGRYISVADADHMVHVEKFRDNVKVILSGIGFDAYSDMPAAA
jgi:pimeloyl-ACP methyl ester carboxylesterase